MKFNDLQMEEMIPIMDLMSTGDELIARYSYSDGSFHRLAIVPDYATDDKQHYDLAGILEYTLHIALDNDLSDEKLWYLFGFISKEEAEKLGYDNLIDIDLGYCVLGDIYAIETVD